MGPLEASTRVSAFEDVWEDVVLTNTRVSARVSSLRVRCPPTSRTLAVSEAALRPQPSRQDGADPRRTSWGHPHSAAHSEEQIGLGPCGGGGGAGRAAAWPLPQALPGQTGGSPEGVADVASRTLTGWETQPGVLPGGGRRGPGVRCPVSDSPGGGVCEAEPGRREVLCRGPWAPSGTGGTGLRPSRIGRAKAQSPSRAAFPCSEPRGSPGDPEAASRGPQRGRPRTQPDPLAWRWGRVHSPGLVSPGQATNGTDVPSAARAAHVPAGAPGVGAGRWEVGGSESPRGSRLGLQRPPAERSGDQWS